MRSAPNIRLARFQDIPQIVDLAKEAKARSRYQSFMPLNESAVKSVLLPIILNSGKEDINSDIAIVSEREGKIEGIILAASRRFYEALDVASVMSLWWYASENAHPRTGLLLYQAMELWAGLMPGQTVIIRVGVTDAINDPEKTASFLERQGMTRAGVILEKEIKKW